MSYSSQLKMYCNLFNLQAVVKQGTVGVNSLSIPTSLQRAKIRSCWRFFQLQFLPLQCNHHTAASEHTSGWSYELSSADGCLHDFIWESLRISFCDGSYFHFRPVCLWWQTAINGTTRCRHEKTNRRNSHPIYPQVFPLTALFLFCKILTLCFHISYCNTPEKRCYTAAL